MRVVRDRNPDQPATDHRLLVPVVHWVPPTVSTNRRTDARAVQPQMSTLNQDGVPRHLPVTSSPSMIEGHRSTLTSLGLADDDIRVGARQLGHSRREEGA